MTGRQVYAYSSQTRDPTYGVSRGRSFSQQSYCVLFGPTKLIAQWWRIQELQKGGARSRRGRIFRSGVCFDAPSHISYLFVARVVNKINNVNIVYWQKSKYMRVIQSNLQKQTRNFFSKRGGGASGVPTRRSWIRFCHCWLSLPFHPYYACSKNKVSIDVKFKSNNWDHNKQEVLMTG